MPEETVIEVADKSKQKKRRRRRRGKKGLNALKQTDTTNNLNPDSKVTDNNRVGTKVKTEEPKRKSRRGLDKYFGRFCCPKCKRTWESACVFTRAGTKKVLFKQRCRDCEDAWINPFRLELIRCSVCKAKVCECLCEDCQKLKHVRYLDEDKDKGNMKVDEKFEYCNCEKRNKRRVGANIRVGEPHLSDLCEKCQKGFPCISARSDDDSPANNEP